MVSRDSEGRHMMSGRHFRMRPRALPRILVAITLLLGSVAVVQFGSAEARAAVLPAALPVADAYVQSDQPSVNFGTALTLNTVSGTPEARAYLKFDVSGVSGTIT